MMLKAGEAGENVDKVIAPGTRFVEEGLYFEHLDRFLQVFEEKQIKCLLYDDLQASPREFMQEVYSHIGVDPSFEPELIEKSYHTRKTRPRFQNIYNILVKCSKWVSGLGRGAAKVVQFVRAKGWVDLFHRLNRGADFPELSPKKSSTSLHTTKMT